MYLFIYLFICFEVNHCVLSYLIERSQVTESLVVRLGHKAHPNTSVEFKLVIFGSKVDVLIHCPHCNL